MSGVELSRREHWLLVTIFVFAAGFHLYGVAYNWSSGFMSGHEFRQAQTAIISYYIDQQNNFSLLYETPILGKPWVSLLLEVPFYEWCVVGLSRATGWPHVIAARAVSVACFYAMLPALYLLLGRLAIPGSRRLAVLALVLTAPVYIYYSRAFLIDAMALMGCVWFLLGFIRTMDERRWSWLAVTVVAGTGAALIKSATLLVWLLPAAGYGAWMLWRDVRAGTGWQAPLKTVLWGSATVVVALGSLGWWLAYTDPIKEAHPSAWIFTSKNLSMGNWGLFDPRPLFLADVWRRLFACWEQAIMSRWLIAAGLVVGLALPAVRGRVALTAGCFFLAQFAMPFAYADQDYYFYSCAVFLHAALGLMLLGLAEARLPRVVILLGFAGLLTAQVRAYWKDYRVGQSAQLTGSFPLTDVLREHTPKNSVIVVAGADWAAMTPLYAQRKALMIRNGLEYDRAYLERAFDDLADEKVSALVLYGPLRTNRLFIELATARLDMDVRAPAFTYPGADVYVPRLEIRNLRKRLRAGSPYPGIAIPDTLVDEIEDKDLVLLTPAEAREKFPEITPGPFQVRFQYGVGRPEAGGRHVLSMHPDVDLWVRPEAGATVIRWSYGILPGAYERGEPRTDGVEFIVDGELPDGESRRVYRRRLNPVQNVADRGDQREAIPYEPRPGEILRFSIRPYENTGFDWAYMTELQVR